jgi:hypothetical protein
VLPSARLTRIRERAKSDRTTPDLIPQVSQTPASPDSRASTCGVADGRAQLDRQKFGNNRRPMALGGRAAGFTRAMLWGPVDRPEARSLS